MGESKGCTTIEGAVLTTASATAAGGPGLLVHLHDILEGEIHLRVEGQAGVAEGCRECSIWSRSGLSRRAPPHPPASAWGARSQKAAATAVTAPTGPRAHERA